MYKRYLKTTLDCVIAMIALLFLTPILVITAIAIRIDSNGKAFFLQERIGKSGKHFKMIKFRSMVVSHPKEKANHNLYENDPRITKVGKIIRKTSIDELPQLFNILKGEMSFLGPRPPVTYFPKKFEEYTPFEKQRFNVKPGISGLAQVRCREIHDWSINIPIDVEYVQNYSFTYDAKLFFTSITFFFRTDNIYHKESK